MSFSSSIRISFQSFPLYQSHHVPDERHFGEILADNDIPRGGKHSVLSDDQKRTTNDFEQIISFKIALREKKRKKKRCAFRQITTKCSLVPLENIKLGTSRTTPTTHLKAQTEAGVFYPTHSSANHSASTCRRGTSCRATTTTTKLTTTERSLSLWCLQFMNTPNNIGVSCVLFVNQARLGSLRTFAFVQHNTIII